jgi:luciferase-type oxidoreductase
MSGHGNAGYRRLFGGESLTFGAVFPLHGRDRATPSPDHELSLAKHAECVGFDALWARDVPTDWPKFGDTGQSYDVWPWLTWTGAHTEKIALGTASVVLPLRHPLHVAKSAASVDRLSEGRLVLGVASGDRPPEYAAFGVNENQRGELFRESISMLRTVWAEEFPEHDSQWGTLDGTVDLVPKPTSETLPLLVTGRSRQSMEWIGSHGDGWLFYHLPRRTLESYLSDWREVGGEKPFAMAMGVELADCDPESIHQGVRARSEWFVEYFRELAEMGVDHVLVSVRGEETEKELTRFAENVMDEV